MTASTIPVTPGAGSVPEAPAWKVDELGGTAKMFPKTCEVWLVARDPENKRLIAPIAFKSKAVAERAAYLFEQALALQDEEPPAKCKHAEREVVWLSRTTGKESVCRLCHTRLGPVEDAA